MIQKFHSWVFIQRKQKLIRKDICTPMFIAALFTTAKDMEITQVLPINRGMDEKDVEYIYIYIYIYICMYIHIYTMDYYSAIKRIKYCHL